MLLFGENWRTQRRWAGMFVLGTLGAVAWHVLASLDRPDRPGGSSAVGLTCGLFAGVIILFELALWLRKKLRQRRLGKPQTWLRAHIWLGLLTIPLALVHSGWRLGGALSAALLILLFLVVASGIWGLWLQTRLPGQMMREFPAEHIASQIERRCQELERDAAQLVQSVSGFEVKAMPAKGLEAKGKEDKGAGYLEDRGQTISTGASVVKRLPGSEPLELFYHDLVKDYLSGGSNAKSLLSSMGTAADLFNQVRSQLPPEGHPALALLENWCGERRLLDQQARLHGLLHGWLLVHFPLSVALVMLLFVHAFAAFKYY